MMLPVFLLFADGLMAENIITSGTTLRVTAGTTMVSSNSLTIQNGGALNNAGTVILAGNLNNLNAAVTNLGTGTINMAGTAAQQINGQNIIQNLTINNAAGVNLNANNSVNGVLTITNGRLTLGANNLFLGTAATIAGTPSASAMVVATAAGQMRKSFSAAGSFSFPVGDNTGTAEYAPVTVSFTGGSYGAGNYVGVNLLNSAYPGATGSYINRYWNITQNGITGFTSNATFKYMQADVVGTENLIYCLRITPTSVVYFSATNTATDLLTANGITEFGSFTGVQQLTGKTLNLTALLESLYDGGGTMRKAQNATGDQFSGNTADQVNIELHSSASYANKIYTISNVNLSTTGTSAITIPGIHSNSYYVTVRHRNSIETTTAAPVSFAGATINYNFDGPVKAYGGNLLLMSDGWYTIYGGDVNQDGSVDTGDMTPVDNDAADYAAGYLPTDANGDGIVDTADITIVDNNGAAYVTSAIP
ncbi:MAG: hypothetical protein IPH20_23185 [Bacteroidales bacterium]|nr:hypothetical protein [Bacteroidales bacterium]